MESNRPAPAPSLAGFSVVAPTLRRGNSTEPRKGIAAVTRFAVGIMQDRCKAVACTMCKFEARRADVIVQNSVAEQFVQHDAPIAGNADRLLGITRSARAKTVWPMPVPVGLPA